MIIARRNKADPEEWQTKFAWRRTQISSCEDIWFAHYQERLKFHHDRSIHGGNKGEIIGRTILRRLTSSSPTWSSGYIGYDMSW